MWKRYLHHGGEDVRPGLYWKLPAGQLVEVEDEQSLPGSTEQRYLRAPVPLLLLFGPLLGLAYVMFLPLAGITIVLGYIGYWLLWRPARATAHGLQGVLAAPAWRFGVSYLARPERRRREKVETRERDTTLEGSLRDLLKEIEEQEEDEKRAER